MSFKRSITVFCGSSFGRSPAYHDAAYELGRLIGRQGRTLVFGGCLDGLMEVVARSASDAGAQIKSVFIRDLYQEKDHLPGATEYILPDVAARKAQLIRLADACVALPGGMGTLDELSSVAAMRQLGETSCPIGLIDTDGYYEHLSRFLDQMRTEGFLGPEWSDLLIKKSSPEGLLDALDAI